MTTASGDCGRCASPLERGDLRCPICNAAAPETAVGDSKRTVVEVLRCGACGAAVSYDARSRAPACAFCGSVTRLEAPEDPPEETQLELPFTVDRTSAERAYGEWLRGLGWFRPSDLGSASRLETMTPLWWVGWVFDAEATVTWTADSDADARRSEWAPHSGQTELRFDDVVVSASRGLTAGETERLIPTYDLETARDAASKPEPGATIERFDLPRSAARGRVGAFIERLVRERLERGAIPGTRFRNVHAAVALRRLVTRRVAFPSYVLAYRYRGSVYRVVISGQDATCVIGTAPTSTAKILAVVLGGLAALALLAAAIAAQ
jgi:hypothetical protein